MKKILSIIVVTLLFIVTYSQKNKPLEVEQFKLKNGLTVYLNVDNSQPNVFGAVVVKGGSKRDPSDATGIAHYFEHIMFKGTDKLGTVNYQKEKVFLDSIQVMYDKLALTSDDEERKSIQLKINKLSVKAADFAIPNEFDKVITKMGGTGINAFTSNEMIAYHNYFPPDQIEKWMEVYSDRFINPVFRMFQSELETVYEEKNMSMDNPFDKLLSEINKNLYKGHPYENTVLGSVEHLKNPSLSKMRKYFETYYVANNMALILVGNFDKQKVKPIIERKFGIWRTGKIDNMPEYTPESFNGRKFVKKRYTPIKIGLIAFRTIAEGHEDDITLEILNNLLSNQAQTGYLDKLYTDNKLMMTGIIPFQHYDMGADMILFVPKLFGQSMKKVEKMVFAEVEKIKSGIFSEEMLESVKTSLKKDFYKGLENANTRGYSIMDAFMLDEQWDEMLKYPDKVDLIKKEEVIRIAKKYYNDQFFVFYSKMGFPKKHKLDKPNYKHLSPKNSEAKSDYALKIENIPTKADDPRFIEFGEDVKFKDVNNFVHYYYTKNEINDIFSINVKFGKGTFKDPKLDQATSYLNNLGTENHTFTEFKKELQKLGGSFYSYADINYTNINIDGLEKNFEATLKLVNQLFTGMKTDDEQLKKVVRNAKIDRKFEHKEPNSIGDALYEYAVYGKNSKYLKRLTVNDIKKLTSSELLESLNDAFSYEVDIHYVGKVDSDENMNLIIKNLILKDLKKTNSPNIIPRQNYDERMVYILNDKKLIQSQISIYNDCKVFNKEDVAVSNAFNEYFGGGMYSLVFQEIREFRSLAYSAWARFYSPIKFGEKAWLRGSMSCQSDKTLEALQIFDSLVVSMPKKSQRMNIIKDALVKSINSYRPNFRHISLSVANWRKKAYDDDPRKQYIEKYEEIEFSQIYDFYLKNIDKSRIIITIAGDSDRFDIDKVKKYGKIIEVNKEDIFN